MRSRVARAGRADGARGRFKVLQKRHFARSQFFPGPEQVSVSRLPMSAALAEVLSLRPTRAQYERAALLLGRIGHVPKHPLKPIDFRVLSYVAHQQPGYTAFHRTIGDELDGLSHDAVHDALHRLHDQDLIDWDLILPCHPLPWGKRADTKVNQYWLTFELVEALETEWARRLTVAEGRRARHLTPTPTLTPPPAPKPPPPPPCPPAPEPLFPTAGEPSPVTAGEPSSSGSDQTLVPLAPPTPSPSSAPKETSEPVEEWRAEILPIIAAFDTLKLRRPCGPRERQAIHNRLGEGCAADELHDAVEGARHSDRLRSSKIRDPFAVVFASTPSVRQFAAEGRSFAMSAPVEPASSPTELPTPALEPPMRVVTVPRGKLRLVPPQTPEQPQIIIVVPTRRKERPAAPLPPYLEAFEQRYGLASLLEQSDASRPNKLSTS